MKKKKINKKYLIPIILFLIFIIFFIFILIKLNIKNINLEKELADAIFLSAKLDDKNVSNLVISKDKKYIDFETKKLKKALDESVLEYSIKNNSKEHSARVNVNCSLPSEDVYTIKNDVVKDKIDDQDITSGEVVVSLNKDIDNDMIISCRLSIKVIEKN